MEGTHLRYVFVYGTLRRTQRNHHLIDGMKCVAERAWIRAALFDTNHGYPAILTSHAYRVFGELYEVDAEQLVTLDQLEGFSEPGCSDNLYERVILTVLTQETSYQAYVYTSDHNPSLCKTWIETGDWVRYSMR